MKLSCQAYRNGKKCGAKDTKRVDYFGHDRITQPYMVRVWLCQKHREGKGLNPYEEQIEKLRTALANYKRVAEQKKRKP